MYSVGDLIQFKRGSNVVTNGKDTVIIEKILEGKNNSFGSHKNERLIEEKTFYFAFGPCVNNTENEADDRVIRSDNWRYWEKIG